MLDKETKDLLPDVIKTAMETITSLTNAPDEMTLSVSLAVANFATQALTNVCPIVWDKTAISEFFVVLVPSGGMKTSVSDLLLKGAKKFEREQEGAAQAAMTKYKIDMKRYNKDIDDSVKTPTLVTPKEPVRPKGYRYRVEKATVNGLLNTLDRVPFAGLFSSDAGEFFSSHSFQDGNKAIEMISTLSKAWSGEDLDRVTGIEDNNIRLHDRRFSMLVMLQEQLAGFLNNSQYKDQGFTNRMLITQCELFEKPEVIDETYFEFVRQQHKKLDAFNDRVYDLLCKVEDRQEKARQMPLTLPGQKADWKAIQARQQKLDNLGPNELVLTEMMFTKDAIKEMLPYYNKLAKLSMHKDFAEYSNFMSRAYEHCCRLAATLAAFDMADEIDVNYAKCAIGLTNYFIEQRLNLNVNGATKISPIVECSEKLYKWLVQQPNKEATKSEMQRSGPGQYRSMDTPQRELVVNELRARDLVEMVEIPSEGTKPRHVLRAI